MNSNLDLRIGPVICLPDIIRQFSQDPAAAFAAAGVDESLFQHPDNRIEMAKLGKLVSVASRMIERPDLGLLVAKSFGPDTLGAVWMVALEGPDVRTSLRKIVQLLHHNDRAAFLVLKEAGDAAVLLYELREPAFEGADLVLVGAIAIAFLMLRGLCGERWIPDEVRLSIRRPVDPRPYGTFFGPCMRFNSAEDSIVFSRHWLDTPVTPPTSVGTDKSLPREKWGFADHVRHQIAMRIGLEATSAPLLAAALGMSRRTLDRRLAEEGLTCVQLIDEVRFARARRLLAAGDVPLSEISLTLGYAAPSGFSRSFRKWTGLSPQAWREAHRAKQSSDGRA